MFIHMYMYKQDIGKNVKAPRTQHTKTINTSTYYTQRTSNNKQQSNQRKQIEPIKTNTAQHERKKKTNNEHNKDTHAHTEHTHK